MRVDGDEERGRWRVEAMRRESESRGDEERE